MARRSLFTVLLAAVLVLTAAPQPEAATSASTTKSFSVIQDGPHPAFARVR